MRHVRARVFCWVLLWCVVAFLAASLWLLSDRLAMIERSLDRPDKEYQDHGYDQGKED